MLAKKFVNGRKLHKGHFGNLNGEQALLLYDELHHQVEVGCLRQPGTSTIGS